MRAHFGANLGGTADFKPVPFVGMGVFVFQEVFYESETMAQSEIT